MAASSTPHPLPTVIITPSTPISDSSEDIALLPSTTQFYPSSSNKHSQSRPKRQRSHASRSYSTEYLLPPARLPSPKTGHRPLRSSLISLALLLMGLTLIASSVLCTGNGANVWIEMKYKGLQKLEGMGRDVGAKLGWNASLQPMATLRVLNMETSGDEEMHPSKDADRRDRSKELGNILPEGQNDASAIITDSRSRRINGRDIWDIQ
ncbi:hypothetical protein CNBG_9699 [Cryptococcus deuterogattii R265]|uniref:uncharacterized protein n=1 Tax=Cryptococcus deuterogattii (strain R265) TaxID=294750 RepID=UPI0005B5B653|nr:hypothetical protein I310_04415 [Cryptococcus deuterogattii CA1014]KIR98493.1 hypothetical protein L804_04066 [Cryptococcus deuterogattii 2001/935-1]QPK66877.1 hypothetical protein CNBG_9699 [Cryptococcus deuterogattii R265]